MLGGHIMEIVNHSIVNQCNVEGEMFYTPSEGGVCGGYYNSHPAAVKRATTQT